MSTCLPVSKADLLNGDSRHTGRRDDDEGRMRVCVSPAMGLLVTSMPVCPFTGSIQRPDDER